MSLLAGKRVLIVEDEPIVAMAIEDMLSDLGCEVVGPASHLAQAEALAGTEALDAAVLDININSGRSYAVADMLHARGVPYVFATGYGADGIEQDGRTVPVLQKPYRQEQVAASLLGLLSAVEG